MVATFKRPGAYVEEVVLPQQINSLGLDIAVGAFVGAAERGSVTGPVFTATWSEFSRQFGGFKRSDGSAYPLAYAAYMFFSNNGRGCWVNRVASGTAYPATITLNDGLVSPTDVLTVTASSPGDWGLATATSGLSLVVDNLSLVSAIQMVSRNASNVMTVTTSASHGLSVGTIVAITGLTGTGANVEGPVLSVIDYKNFTIASTGSSYTEGDMITATSGAVSPSTDTFAVSVLLGGTTNGYLVEKFNDLSLDPAAARYALQVINTNSAYIQVALPAGFVAPVVGGVNVYRGPSTNEGIPVGLGRPTVNVVTVRTAVPTAVAWATNVVTVTAANAFVVGDQVTISNVTVAGSVTNAYNGTFAIATATGTQFTYALATNPGTAAVSALTLATSSHTVPTLITGSLDGAALQASELIAAATGLDALNPNLVVNVPDAAILSESDAQSVYTAYLGMLDNRGDSFMVMDTPAGLMPSEAIGFAADITPKSSNGAIYYPNLVIPDPSASSSGSTRTVAPGGAVVGLYLATDASRGAWKAPAGVGAALSNVVALERKLSSGDLDALNTAITPVNSIRSVPGAGICVFGARTVSNDTRFRYVNTRRTMLQIKKSLLDATQFAIFEGNDTRLWAQLRTVCTTYLNGVWQSGGLKGSKAGDAFYVVCDATNNSLQSVSDGQVVIEVGVALQVPAEFVIIRIGQFDGGSSATVTN
jgi:phage tail sheath protein FI